MWAGDGDDHMTFEAGGRGFGGDGNDTFVFGFDGRAGSSTFDGGNGDDTVVVQLAADADGRTILAELEARGGDLDGHIASLDASFDGIEHVIVRIGDEVLFG